MRKNKWINNIKRNAPEELINYYKQKYHPVIISVLWGRGYDTVEKIDTYFSNTIDNINDPYNLTGMPKAVSRIIEAKVFGETICIYGDYDVDGITSTSILLRYFELININCFYYIPNRIEEGYGLNKKAIEKINLRGADIILTVDNGITAIDEIKYINQCNMDVIVTDHHEPFDTLPDAVAIINPKQPGDKYPCKDLCGAGVAMKLIQGINKTLEVEEDIDDFYPLVALATVADIVPLRDENRIFATYGIKKLNNKQYKNIGLKELIKISNLENTSINTGHIGFGIGPRINAAGRMGLTEKAIELLTTNDGEVAAVNAKILDDENKKRQLLEKKICEEAIKIIEKNNYDELPVIVVSNKEWHSGIIGIVGSRLQEKYYKPVIIIAEEEKGKGSCRSIVGFNIFEALKSCNHLFESFGGHEQAAGLTISLDRIDTLRKEINEYAVNNNIEECLTPYISYDAKIDGNDISQSLYENIEKMAPFGIGNPKPKFLMDDVHIRNIRKLGKERLHFSFNDPFSNVKYIGFSQADKIDNIELTVPFEIIGSVENNQYQGNNNIQIQIKDIRPSKLNRLQYDKALFRLIIQKDDFYCSLIRNEPLKTIEKNDVVYMYTYDEICNTLEKIENRNLTCGVHYYNDVKVDEYNLNDINIVICGYKNIGGKKISYIANDYLTEQTAERYFFNRNMLKVIYTFIKRNNAGRIYLTELSKKIHLSYFQIFCGVEILKEMNLINCMYKNNTLIFEVVSDNGKKSDIQDTYIMIQLKRWINLLRRVE
jgi:single-stranded-DNA-specific exonuclease